MKRSPFVAATLLVTLFAATSFAQPPKGHPGEGGFRPPHIPLLAALDADHDQVISAEEIAAAAKSLKSLDKNSDGKLTRDELRPSGFSRHRHGSKSHGEAKSHGHSGSHGKPGPPWRHHADGNRSGEHHAGGPPRRGNFLAFLMKLDKDKDGKLSKSELPERMQRLMRADANKDGFVDKTELEKVAQHFRSAREGRSEGKSAHRPEGRRHKGHGYSRSGHHSGYHRGGGHHRGPHSGYHRGGGHHRGPHSGYHRGGGHHRGPHSGYHRGGGHDRSDHKGRGHGREGHGPEHKGHGPEHKGHSHGQKGRGEHGTDHKSHGPSHKGHGLRGGPPSPEAFVKRAMTFDADKDGKLDGKELQKMAQQIIKSHGGPRGESDRGHSERGHSERGRSAHGRSPHGKTPHGRPHQGRRPARGQKKEVKEVTKDAEASSESEAVVEVEVEVEAVVEVENNVEVESESSDVESVDATEAKPQTATK